MAGLAAVVCASVPTRAEQLPEPDSSARPGFEAGVLAGATWPMCGENDCEGDVASPGFSLGLLGLARPAASFGIGLFAEQTRYAWHAKTFDFDAPDEAVHITTVTPILRFYPLEQGWAEPWMSVGLGIVTGRSTVASVQCSDYVGPVAQIIAGFDGYVAPWLRLSSALVAGVGRTMQSCTEAFIPNDPPPTPSPSSAVGFRLGATLALGR
jgi:hypothetical protein